jgi:fructan beta-fructosidase
VTSRPVKELDALEAPANTSSVLPAMYRLGTTAKADVKLIFSNAFGDSAVIGYDAEAGAYYIDRRHAGVAVGTDFDRRYSAPRISKEATIDLRVYSDVSSFEVFADGGLTVMTALVFPTHPYTLLRVRTAEGVKMEHSVYRLRTIH